MSHTITIPRLGWSMEEGVFAGWLKRDGDAVAAGEPLFSLEGEKATQDVESTDSGVLRIPADAPQTGDTVAVGAVIGYLVADGVAAPASVGSVARTIAPIEVPHNESHQHRPDPSPDRPRSSPLARRLARELGVDWTTLRGSGSTGRVRKADVLAAAKPRTSTRKTIAARMVESTRTTAPVTLTTTIDASNLVNLRRQFKASGQNAPGITDIFIKLSALALLGHPRLHSRLIDDRLETPDAPHIGFAVDTDAGLLVPVVAHAATLGLREISSQMHGLIERARAGRLRAGDMQGGTFTVTNLGAFGIEAFTPIINPPETAILGLGRIARKPVFESDTDRVVARDEMVLSLTFDHRVVDGAPAARFLQHLGKMVENPAPWLLP
jgi:pyruvate dehydrogenase E2 component (dihydrolipoamide acetyltransferase)